MQLVVMMKLPEQIELIHEIIALIFIQVLIYYKIMKFYTTKIWCHTINSTTDFTHTLLIMITILLHNVDFNIMYIGNLNCMRSYVAINLTIQAYNGFNVVAKFMSWLVRNL